MSRPDPTLREQSLNTVWFSTKYSLYPIVSSLRLVSYDMHGYLCLEQKGTYDSNAAPDMTIMRNIIRMLNVERAL
jgi:hypothetical protein